MWGQFFANKMLASGLRTKYKMHSLIKPDGFKIYFGGKPPVQAEDWVSEVVLSIFQDENYYGVKIQYGPYDYINEEF